MGKRRNREADLDDVGPGLTEEGSVQVVRSPSGEAFFRPAIRPRAWDRLSEEGQDHMAHMQALAARIHELQGHLEEDARWARDIGVSWDLIGWSVGTSGEAARQRWGIDKGED